MTKLPLGLLVLCALTSACATAPTAQNRTQELKVSRAVLYQNGIGYFERRGKLEGDVLRIRVRPDQIRDVLKSLTVVDLTEGRAVSIALPIEKSRGKQLSELPEQVRNQGGLLATAQAFRGARCKLVAAGVGAAKGRLVGAENLGSSQTPDWRISVLTDDAAVRQFKVVDITELEILDGTLEIGLRKALDVALDAGSWKPVELSVRLSGRSPHDLVVSYVVEMPAWKPAYRLVVGDEGKALLQGWAVVDNVSGDDWSGVSLSLTAGTPLAFTYDLYTPRFPQRPHLQAQNESANIPLDAFQTQGGIAMKQQMSAAAPPPPSRAKSRRASRQEDASGPAGFDGPSSMAAAPESVSELEPQATVDAAALERSYRTMVAGSTVGSLFRYDLKEPVTIDERQSALVSIINARLPGEDVLLFRVGSDGVSPYRAVRFRNDTGFVLESGPIAIYRNDGSGGTFLGEALSSRLEKSADTFVPYALDGRVRVTLSEEQKDEGLALLKVVNGQATLQNRRVTRYSYDVDNGSDAEATLYVRRERRAGWELLEKEKMIEEGGAYYLPIKLPKSGRTKVTVAEQTPVRQTVSIFSDAARQAINLYVSETKTDSPIAKQLKEALELQARAQSLQARSSRLDEQKQLLEGRENDVRRNIEALVGGRRYAGAKANEKLLEAQQAVLAELDGKLANLTREIVELSIERGAVTDKLAAAINAVSLQ